MIKGLFPNGSRPFCILNHSTDIPLSSSEHGLRADTKIKAHLSKQFNYLCRRLTLLHDI